MWGVLQIFPPTEKLLSAAYIFTPSRKWAVSFSCSREQTAAMDTDSIVTYRHKPSIFELLANIGRGKTEYVKVALMWRWQVVCMRS